MKQKQDFFTALGGRVKFTRGAYNITGDPVWLAAFAAASRMTNVLDVGIGTGGAALCLLEHLPDLKVTGIDISEQMLAECAENARLNNRTLELVRGDITTWKTNQTFDAVITNPPYFRGTPRKGTGTRNGKNEYVHHNADLAEWTSACLKRVRPRGYFYCIIDAAATAEVISALHAGRAGDIMIVPLFSFSAPCRGVGQDFVSEPAGEPTKSGVGAIAERVLIGARAGTRGGTKIFSGPEMNDETVLRDAKILTFGKK